MTQIFNFLFTGIRFILFLVAGIIGQLLLPSLIRHILRQVKKAPGLEQEESEQRLRTFTGVLTSLGSIVLWVIIILSLLSEVGIDISPFITGAGILGLAIGFGTQNLVRDLVSGFFILFENQFNQGDLITTAGKMGRVKKINLRTTILEEDDGTIHIIPNSQISLVSKKKV